MILKKPVLCIGSVLWDVIGRATIDMEAGSDNAGRITRLPGGVAMNIAMALRKHDIDCALLTALGRDDEGDGLIKAAQDRGLVTDFIFRSEKLPTDIYMAVEGANGLIAAIADASSLEAAGTDILIPLMDGSLSDGNGWHGTVVVDGNLTVALLDKIAQSTSLQGADLRIAPASPGKAERLRVFFERQVGMVYVNQKEAQLIADVTFSSSEQAAQGLLALGIPRVLVTDGSNQTAYGDRDEILVAQPPAVKVSRVTGAGDVLMAAHIAAELGGKSKQAALDHALNFAADYVSGDRSL
jgi:pseudouridine kinase